MKMKSDGGSTGGEGDAHDAHSSLAKLAEPQVAPWRIGSRLRNYLLTGLIIVGPVTITLYIVWWAINVVDAWVKPLLPDLASDLRAVLPERYLTYIPDISQVSIPGVGLVTGMIMLTVIGALAANLFGRTLISYGEMMLGRMPVVRNVYGGLKQIFETVLSQSSSTFQNVGLIEYPRKGIYSIVFISTVTKGEIQSPKITDQELVSVFLPTTPNPTSGFLLFVPRNDVLVLDMSVEEAAKMVISAGLVTPPYQEQLGELAANAHAEQPAAMPASAARAALSRSTDERPGAAR